MKKLLIISVLGMLGFNAFGFSLESKADGAWDDVGTWGGVVYPQAGDDALITHTVSMSGNEAAANLNLSGSLDANGQTLSLSAALTQTGGVLADGSFNAYTLNWSGGTIRQCAVGFTDGTIDPSSTVYLDVASLSASGTINQTGAGAIYFYNTGSVITNNGTWNYLRDGTPFIYNGTFVNRGTFRKSAGTNETTISVPFVDQSGTVAADSGVLRFSGSGMDLSNTVLSAASGSRIEFAAGGNLRGSLAGSGQGAIRFSGGNFYPQDSCSLSMSSGSIEWTGGQLRDGDLATSSKVDVIGSSARWLVNGTWTADGGIDHTGTGSLSMQSATLVIPSGKAYSLKQDGGLLSNSAGSKISLSGTLEKTAGGGTTTVNVPIYSDGAAINVATGTLSLTGSGAISNLTSLLGDGTTLSYSGLLSNAVVVSADSAAFYPAYSDSTVCGLLQVTNIDVRLTTGTRLYAAPSLTVQGTNSSFVFSKGQLRDGVLTNAIPFQINDGGARYIYACQIHSLSDVDINGSGTSFQYSTWTVPTGVTNRINTDGEILTAPVYSSYVNQGTLHKTVDGTAGMSVPFYDTDGIILVDDGILWLTDSANQFKGTSVQLAEGAVFQMAGSVTSNLTVIAAGSATLKLASGNNQAVQTDLSLNGPITTELTGSTLTMNGSITGSQASFRASGGKIENSSLTNAVPCSFIGSSQFWIVNSTVDLQQDTVHSNLSVWLQYSTMTVSDGTEYQIISDGTLLSQSGTGTLRNEGSFIKTAGTGQTDVNVIFQNAGGTVGAYSGTLKLYSALDLTGGGLSVQLGGTNDYGKVQAYAVTADGLLSVALRDGYVPAVGDSFTVLSGSSLSGTFSSNSLPELSEGLEWDISYSSTAVTLSVVESGDSDNDAMDDDWETANGLTVGVDDSAENPDGDAFDNLSEYIADTCPTNAASFFAITSLSNGSPAAIFFNSSSNRNYTLLGCTNLVEGGWQTLAGPRIGTGGADSFSATNSLPAGCYKLTVELPE